MPVMGLESELLLGARSEKARACRKDLAARTVNSVPAITCCVPNAEGPVSPMGFMLGSTGGRIYLDVGHYVEHATPEVRQPLEVLVTQRANELILLEALRRAARSARVAFRDVALYRCTKDYAGHYSGLHLNVSAERYSAAQLVAHLTPFLVTRYYSRAGGFGAEGFVMSHKNVAVRCVASEDTRENRGLVNLKEEPLAGGGQKRIHLTHCDACMSEVAMFLTVGCTALVIAMLDAGVCVGPAYELADPIGALRMQDGDVDGTLPLPLACGRQASALEIQEHYLATAERYCKRSRPAWMRRVTALWRQTLDALRCGGPDALSRVLDPYIKRKLYCEWLERRGTSLAEFSRWCAPVRVARSHLPRAGHRDVRGQLRNRMPRIRFDFLAERMDRSELPWSDLPRATGLYNEMVLLDMGFHNIDPREGLYFRLRGSGAIDSRLVSEKDVKKAMAQPPRGTRAEARAAAIRSVVKDKTAVASWAEVRTETRIARLADPDATSYTWEKPDGGTGASK